MNKPENWYTQEQLETECDMDSWYEAVSQRDEYIAELEKEIEKLKSNTNVELPTNVGG